MLLVDTSTSNLFGTTGKRKKDLVTEILRCFVSVQSVTMIKVGAFFSDGVEKYIALKREGQHALYIVRQLLSMEPLPTARISAKRSVISTTPVTMEHCLRAGDFLDEG